VAPAAGDRRAGSGHIDIVAVLLLVVSFAALLRRWRATAAVAFALAIAVKFLPLLLLPLYWRRVRIRDALLGAIVFALLYLPFLNHGEFQSARSARTSKAFVSTIQCLPRSSEWRLRRSWRDLQLSSVF